MNDFASSWPSRFLPRRVSGSSAWQAEAFAASADVRVVPPENLHVTLVFLGERPSVRAGRDRRRAARGRGRGVAARCSTRVRYRETRQRRHGRPRRRGRRRGAAPGRSRPAARAARASTVPSDGRGCRTSRSCDFAAGRGFELAPPEPRAGQSVRSRFLHFKTAPRRSAVRDPGICPVRRVNAWTASRHLKPR